MMVMRQRLQHRILAWGLCFIFFIAISILGLPSMAHAQSIQKSSATEIPTQSAGDAFRAAYENRYTWDEQFPGYSAEVSINTEGELYQGIVRVKPDLSVEVANINKEEVPQLIANQLRMEVIHRRRVPFEKLHGQKRFELEGTDESGAVKIREVGDGMDSHYKVKDKVITQVNRKLGDVAVTVDTLGTAKTSEGYLVAHFQTAFRNPQTGEVIEKQDVRDLHEKIGKYYLLTYRAIRSLKQGNPGEKLAAETLIRFNDIQPL
jgi:hypothetical protein